MSGASGASQCSWTPRQPLHCRLLRRSPPFYRSEWGRETRGQGLVGGERWHARTLPVTRFRTRSRMLVHLRHRRGMGSSPVTSHTAVLACRRRLYSASTITAASMTAGHSDSAAIVMSPCINNTFHLTLRDDLHLPIYIFDTRSQRWFQGFASDFSGDAAAGQQH